MKVKVSQTQMVEVDINDNDAKNIALKYLYELYNWRESYYINYEGDVIAEVHGRQKFVRKAKEEDYNANDVLEQIQDKILYRS